MVNEKFTIPLPEEHEPWRKPSSPKVPGPVTCCP
jgi:hypothetical protein